ncbi:MAG: DeoR/GlpR family DNA-binding transcription regulator [Longicatena sp.]
MNNRLKSIQEILFSKGEITLQELSDNLQVSLVTIRKDVTELQKEGLAVRHRGKVALPSNHHAIQQPYRLRKVLFENEKSLIAKKVMEYITEDDSIILDSGTTTYAIAKELFNHSHISIATNSICAANILNDSEHSLFLAGGLLSSRGMCTVGGAAEDYFKSIHANKAFIATTGVREDLSLTVTLDIEIGVKKAMVEAADEIILVATSDKFHNNNLFSFCTVDKINKIITTHPAPPEAVLKLIDSYGIELIYAD